MNIKPLYDRVIVKPDEEEKTTASGIVLADVATERPTIGTVVAVGPGAWVNGLVKPMTVVVGSKVLYGKYTGQSFKIDGSDFLQMKEEDIIGVVSEE